MIEVFLVPELSVYKFVSAVHKQIHYIEMVRSTISNSEIHIQLQIWYNYNLMNQNFNLYYVYPTCPGSRTTVTVQRELTTLGISSNMDMYVRQRGEPGQAQVPIPPLKQTNKYFEFWFYIYALTALYDKKQRLLNSAIL